MKWVEQNRGEDRGHVWMNLELHHHHQNLISSSLDQSQSTPEISAKSACKTSLTEVIKETKNDENWSFNPGTVGGSDPGTSEHLWVNNWGRGGRTGESRSPTIRESHVIGGQSETERVVRPFQGLDVLPPIVPPWTCIVPALLCLRMSSKRWEDGVGGANASAPLLHPHASTVLQAGILMSLLGFF